MKRILIVLLTMCMLICCAQAAFAKRIVFANEGAGDITALYLYRASDNHTSANLLNGNILSLGFGCTVAINPLKFWSVIIETSRGQRISWDNIDFSDKNIMFLYVDRAEYQ